MKLLRICLRTGGIPILFFLAALPAAWGGPLSLAGFTLGNLNADGTVVSSSALNPGDLSSFDLTGGNNGSGIAGDTTFLWLAPVAATVQFDWGYTSCDPAFQQPKSTACDQPGFDAAGYMIGNATTQLTDTDTGNVAFVTSFQVSAGALFGWYVSTMDNMGEPGTLSVFSATFTPTGVGAPEPGTLTLGLACCGLLAGAYRTKARFATRRTI